MRAGAYYLRAGDIHREAKAVTKAVEAYQSAIRVAPDQQQAYYKLATLFLDHRTPQPAVTVLTAAASRFEKESEYQRLLGLAWYQLGEMEKAISAFLAACDLAPGSDVAYASLETLLTDAGPRLPEITSRLRSFRERRPESPVGHFLLGRALQVEHASSAEIEALFTKAIGADPTFWPAYYELGQMLSARGRTGEGLKALSRVVELNSNYAPAHYSLARLYAATGDRERAVVHRKTHHELVRQEREAAQRQRANAPALLYRIEDPAAGRNP
jgi:tetratricopeptide (TPR) repeat protein